MKTDAPATVPYVRVPRHVLEREDLTASAKLLFGLIQTLDLEFPKEPDINMLEAAAILGIGGRTAYRAFNELKEGGVL